MKLRHHQQAGFGLPILIVAVVVLVAIGGIGFFVYNQHTRTKSAIAKSDVVPPAPAPSKADPKPDPATPTTTGATLTVKEWGVTIPLPESIKSAYYVPSTASADSDGSVNTIWLGLTSKDTSVCKAALGNTGGSTLGAVVRTAPDATHPVTGKLYSELYSGTVIGNYFYGYGASVDRGNKCGAVESRKDINDAFSAAVKNTTATANTAN
jgi:hypothetical protein